MDSVSIAVASAYFYSIIKIPHRGIKTRDLLFDFWRPNPALAASTGQFQADIIGNW